MNRVLFKRLDPRAKIPTKAYNSAGFDLYALEPGIIMPGDYKKIPLGFAAKFPHGYVALIDDRSSVGNAGITHLAGVIDSDYRGPWMVIMCNVGPRPWTYSPGKAIAQVLFQRVESPDWVETDTLEGTTRGERGFGSSGA